MAVRLQINVDHVATLRQARGTGYPDPIRVAELGELAGVDGITVHLREDRRHIQDSDVQRLRRAVRTRLNLEMAATSQMVEFATAIRPDSVTLVPERREEKTTEGGLDVVGQHRPIAAVCDSLRKAGIPTYLFIDPDLEQIKSAIPIECAGLELHTGDFANATVDLQAKSELMRLGQAATFIANRAPQMVIAAGHGLTLGNVEALVREVPELMELNIGHALISDAIVMGIQQAVSAFRRAIQDGQRGRPVHRDRDIASA
jgi:pyridoxine 5-phosphate synthase